MEAVIMVAWSADGGEELDMAVIEDVRARVPQAIRDAWPSWRVPPELGGLTGTDMARAMAAAVVAQVNEAMRNTDLSFDVSSEQMSWKYYDHLRLCCGEYMLELEGSPWTVTHPPETGNTAALKLTLSWAPPEL